MHNKRCRVRQRKKGVTYLCSFQHLLEITGWYDILNIWQNNSKYKHTLNPKQTGVSQLLLL